MLTASHRLRQSAEFTRTTRNGSRAAQSLLVAHYYLPAGATGPAKVGFTVSSAVGGSVVRHRVTRQLRAGCQVLLPDLPAGSKLVIRALPRAAQAPASQLQSELRSVVRAALAKAATK
ncbi:MAG: ribonuclease P protein component [Candidatus Nanopelagicales bacterium]|nr:ribonuclease P protein component [Candidatus Nanopelagicales bacterium]